MCANNNWMENYNIDLVGVLLAGLFCYFLIVFMYIYMIERPDYSYSYQNVGKQIKGFTDTFEFDKKKYQELCNQYQELCYKIQDMHIKYEILNDKFENMNNKFENMVVNN